MTSIPLRRTDAETPWQRVTNWLAILVLLGLGFVAGPSDLAGENLSAVPAVRPDFPAMAADVPDARVVTL